MNILEIPGYAEAVLRERVVRDASFLAIAESIGPFEVVPMTLRHYLALRIVHSPLLGTETPSPDELTSFLWLLATKYTPSGGRAKRRFVKQCRRLFYPPRYLPLVNTAGARARHERKRAAKLAVAAEVISRAREFVAEATQDMPPARKSKHFDAEYLGDGAFFCAMCGREYGFSQEETLNTPLKRLFQYCNENKIHHGSQIPLTNQSDKVRSRWMRGLPQNRKGGCSRD